MRIFPDTIICKVCGIEKTNNCFYKSNGRIRHVCKVCVRKNARNKYHNDINEIISYKSSIGCKKCGEKRGYLLDFHHRNPKEKEYTIGRDGHANLNKIKKEIEKCDLLCANCHREFHYMYYNGIVKSYNDWLGE